MGVASDLASRCALLESERDVFKALLKARDEEIERLYRASSAMRLAIEGILGLYDTGGTFGQEEPFWQRLRDSILENVGRELVHRDEVLLLANLLDEADSVIGDAQCGKQIDAEYAKYLRGKIKPAVDKWNEVERQLREFEPTSSPGSRT